MSLTDLFRRFRRDDDGVYSIEFAMVFPIVLAVTMSVFELGWLAMRIAHAEIGMYETARYVRTGQAPAADASGPCGNGEACFAAMACASLHLLSDCDTRLGFEVRTFASFAAVTAAYQDPMPCAPDQTTIGPRTYQPGDPSDIVRVRLCYVTDTLTPFLPNSLGAALGDHVAIAGAYVVLNEPFVERVAP